MQQAIDTYGLPWHVTRLGCRVEYLFHAERARTGAQAAAAGDEALDRLIHLYALNRGILLTPFHNMALMSPATTEADVDRHTEVFDDGGARADRGLARDGAARVPGARVELERAARLAEQREALVADRLLPVGGSVREVRAGRADRERERLPEVVEVRRTSAEVASVPSARPRGPRRPRRSAISPSRTPTRACSPSASGSTVRAARQNVLSIVMPPPGTSHMHAATTPPGRVTRAISRTPAAASRMNATTSERQRGVERAVLERQLLGHAHAHVGARVARPARVGELLGGVDRGDVVGAEPRRELARQPARAAADVERAHAGRDPGGVGERDRQRAGRSGP